MKENDIQKALGAHAGMWFGMGNLFRDRPPVLYHYTTLSGFMDIVRSKQIWATNLNYLNDVTEAREIWSFITKRLAIFKANGRTFNGINLDEVVRLSSLEQPKDHFVAAFSEARDSLGQWRAYSGSNGICVGFHEASLNTQWISDPNGGESHWTSMLPYKVRYLPGGEDDTLDRELENLLVHGAPFGKVPSHSQAIVIWLSNLAISFKHEAFKEELEWRLCFSRHEKPMRHQRFRVGKSMLIPYIAADLNLDSKKQQLVKGSFMSEVIVGPSPNMELTRAAVEQFLLTQGHEDVRVVLSTTPYRDW